jgi:hypothetical protein
MAYSKAKEVEESGRNLISRYCPSICLEGLNKTTKKPKSRQPVPGPRFEPGTSRILNRSVNHSNKTLVAE